MSSFGKRSLGNLETAHEDLQKLFKEVVKGFDCSILQGHRSKREQDRLYHEGKSKVIYPNSKHNSLPSNAIDAVPYYAGEGIPWADRERFVLFAGYVLGIASQMGIRIRSGIDWDSDRKIKDHSFFDGPHFELIDG